MRNVIRVLVLGILVISFPLTAYSDNFFKNPVKFFHEKAKDTHTAINNSGNAVLGFANNAMNAVCKVVCK